MGRGLTHFGFSSLGQLISTHVYDSLYMGWHLSPGHGCIQPNPYEAEDRFSFYVASQPNPHDLVRTDECGVLMDTHDHPLIIIKSANVT